MISALSAPPQIPMRRTVEPDEEDAEISKSQRKREVEALQDLGGELVKLSRDQLKKMNLPERLHLEILEAQRITQHGATRRQLQLIGKIMRDVDPEPIREHLAVIRGESDVAKAEFHALERWRERLLADDAALTDWLARHPQADVQYLRQLIRNARKEAAESRPPKSSRLLFKLLRDANTGA